MKQKSKVAAVSLTVLTFAAIVIAKQTEKPAPTTWQREERTDQLRGTKFLQFSLEGKFLTAPRDKSNATPTMIVRCSPGDDHRGHTKGKFQTGYIYVGTVVNSDVSDSGDSFISVQLRLDDGKLQSEAWGRSTDFSAIFFPSRVGSGWDTFANLLYAHHLYHKENTNPQVRKVVLGVNEYLGGEIVMQFDFPDSTEVADACGVIWQ